MSVVERLLSEVGAAGWRAAVAPYTVRTEAREDIARRYHDGAFDEEFYAERIAPLIEACPEEIADPRSFIAVTVPDRPVRIRFVLPHGTLVTRVPPTYLHGERSDRAIETSVCGMLEPFGFTAAIAGGPEKSMLTRSGLGRYGRNNVTYVEGMGSYHRPVVLVSDLPYEGSGAGMEPSVLPACRSCTACLAACPSGAIGKDRFLLHAERCLTFWNEKPPETPFPDWIHPEWHNALVGCFRCQEACPENRALIDSTVEGPTFDVAATAMLLAGTGFEALPPGVQETLRNCDLVGYLDVLPRNLSALVARAERLGTWKRGTQGEDRP